MSKSLPSSPAAKSCFFNSSKIFRLVGSDKARKVIFKVMFIIRYLDNYLNYIIPIIFVKGRLGHKKRQPRPSLRNWGGVKGPVPDAVLCKLRRLTIFYALLTFLQLRSASDAL